MTGPIPSKLRLRPMVLVPPMIPWLLLYSLAQTAAPHTEVRPLTTVTLEGRVVSPSGKPQVGLYLQAVTPLENETACTDPSAAPNAPFASAITDREGRYRLEGLLPGSYRLLEGDPRLETRATLATSKATSQNTSQGPVPLVSKRCSLAIQLETASKVSWPEPIALKTFWSGPMFPTQWSREPRISVIPLGGALSLEARFLPGISLGDGLAMFDVQCGARYAVAVWGGPFEPSVQTAAFVEEGESARLVFRATEHPSSLALLQTNLRRNEGSSSDRSWIQGVQVRLEDPEFGIPLLYVPVDPYGECQVLFAPGTYRLVAEGHGDFGGPAGGPLQERTLGRTEQSVTIAPSVWNRVECVLGKGGRIRVRVDATNAPIDEAMELEPTDCIVGEFPDCWDEIPTPRAMVWLEQAGHLPERVAYRDPTTNQDLVSNVPYWSQLSWDWRLGEALTSEVLPVGDFELVARLPGGREVRQSIAIRPDQQTSIELRIE